MIDRPNKIFLEKRYVFKCIESQQVNLKNIAFYIRPFFEKMSCGFYYPDFKNQDW